MRKTITCLFMLLCSPAWGADVPVPVATDSRIKTFVYSENDVFNIVTYYGYQSNVEFGIGEDIETISLGERASWQIVPAGRRLFIRALTTSAHTNMTIITNKHAYQFDLTSVPTPLTPNEELAYVVRFFYPGDKKNSVPAVYTDDVRSAGYGGGAALSAPIVPSPAAPAPFVPAPVAAAPQVPAMPSSASAASAQTENYSYTFSGSDTLAPVKLYDDGNSTYFKFRDASVSPSISVVAADGKETVISARHSGEYWVVDTIAPRFTVRQGKATVCVYNEKLSHS